MQMNELCYTAIRYTVAYTLYSVTATHSGTATLWDGDRTVSVLTE